MIDPFKLPVPDRIQLVQDLWDSIAADLADLPIGDAQRNELDLRLAALNKDRDHGHPAAAFLQELRNRC